MSKNKPVQLGLCCMNTTLKKQKPAVYASRRIIVRTIEKHSGYKVACLEEISYNNGFIDKNLLIKISNEMNNDYGSYLKQIINEV